MVLTALGALAFDSGCAATVPTPASGPVPKTEMVLVPYPPPPAKVESIPKQQKVADVWVDGQWDWDGKNWRWQEGRWMTPPANAYFTPWATERRKDGRLYFTPAAWRGSDGRRLDVYPTLAACVREDVAQSQ